MKLLFRIFLSLSFLLWGMCSGYAVSVQPLPSKGNNSCQLSSPQSVADVVLLHNISETSVSRYATSLPDKNSDKYFETESEDESDELSYLRKFTGSSSYFSSFNLSGSRLLLSRCSVPLPEPQHLSGYAYQRYILFRSIRI